MSENEQLMKKTNATILVIDDQEDILFTAKMLLKKQYETIYTLNNPKNVIQLLAENEIDLVLLDMNYRIGFEDGREGLYFLKEIKKLSPNTIVLLMTAFGKVETAVEGLKNGAFDYVLKPWDNEKLLETIKKNKPIIVFEFDKDYHLKTNLPSNFIFKMLKKEGYSFQIVGQHHLKSFEIENFSSGNILAKPQI